MAPGPPCPPHSRSAALLLVPYDEMEEVFVDVGLPGEQGAAQLLATMAKGAGEVEIFVAARGTEGAMNRGGGKLCLGQGSRQPGVHPTLGQTLHQAGWVLPLRAFPRLGLGRGLRQGGGAEPGAPIPICHRAYHHTGGCRGGGGGALPCGRCRATIRGGLRGAGGQGMPAFPRLPALFGASHQGEYIKDRTKARGPRRGGCCRRRCLARPPHEGLLPSPRAGPKAGTGTEAPNKGARR